MLLLLPFVALGGLNWLIRRSPLYVDPQNTKRRPVGPSDPPQVRPPELQPVTVIPKDNKGRFLFAIKAHVPVVRRTNLPEGVTNLHIDFHKWRIVSVHGKRNGVWSAVKAISEQQKLDFYPEDFKYHDHDLEIPLTEVAAESLLSAHLRNIPQNTEAVRVKVQMTGTATYNGIWPRELKTPAELHVTEGRMLAESISSPPAEIELKTRYLSRPDLLPSGE